MTTFFLAVTFHYKKLTKSGKLFRNVYTLQNPPITCTSYSLKWLFGVMMFFKFGMVRSFSFLPVFRSKDSILAGFL